MIAFRIWFTLCAAWPAQAFDSTFVGYDGKEYQNPVKWERSRLRRFLGLRHKPHVQHPVVIKSAEAVHHGLHMLNHRVNRMGPLQGQGPLLKPWSKVKMLKPFGKANHSLNHTLDISVTEPIATYKVGSVEASEEPNKGWDAIKLARANMCVDMLKKHGVDFTDNKDKCMAFMEKTCKVPPGKGANHIKRPSGKGVCEDWFDLLNAMRNGIGAAPGAAPSPMPFMAASPAAAPPGMMPPAEKSGWGSMDESAGAPEQGFQGARVAHDNMKTMTDDWHTEYGPHVATSYEAICAEYPDNTWCKLRGYRAKKALPKSAAPRLQALILTLAAPILACLYW